MRNKTEMMKLPIVLTILILFLPGCTSIERYVHMHRENALTPNTYQYQDGGTSIFYTFTTTNKQTPDTYLFFYGGSGCPSWKAVMPDYVNGLTVSARVFVLNKRFVNDTSMGLFSCGDDFHKANNMQQWTSDYSEFIATKLREADATPKNVVLVGVSEGAISAIQVAGKMSEISHVAIIGDGGYTMRKSLETLNQSGKISFEVNKGWEKIKEKPHSLKDSWYGNRYRWWYEIMDYDPMPDYMKLDIPILLGIGEMDKSVPVESAYYLASEFQKAGKSNLILKIYKGADHRLSDGSKSYRDEFFSLLSQSL